MRPMSQMVMPHATRQGSSISIEKFVADTAPMFHNTSPAGSPITVSAPPQLADTTMADPKIMRCRRLCMMPCIMISIMSVVVRLSRFAEMKNVMAARLQSMRWLLRVFSS